MKLNRTGSNWTELERNKINENWDIIEGSHNKLEDGFDDVVGKITDEVVGHLIDSARLDWKEPVDTVEDLPANAEVGETRMVREADPDGVSYVYRYDGEKWEKIQEIDVTLVNEVDRRLTRQLAETDDRVTKTALSVGSQNTTSVSATKIPTPTLTIIDDDTKPWGLINKLMPIVRDKNIEITAALITGRIGTPDAISYDQFKDLKESGLVEFVNHSENHIRPEGLSLEEIDNEIRNAEEWLRNEGVFSSHYVYPYGVYTHDIRRIASKYVDSASLYVDASVLPNGSPVINPNRMVLDSYYLPRMVLEQPIEEIKNNIDAAVEENGWIILNTHSAYVDFDIEKLEDIIDYGILKGIRFKKFSDAYRDFSNALELRQNGSLQAGMSATGFTQGFDGLKFINGVEHSYNSPVSDYQQDKITFEVIRNSDYEALGFPFAGTLMTFRHGLADDYSYQELENLTRDLTLKRRWSPNRNNWTDFVIKNGIYTIDRVLSDVVLKANEAHLVTVGFNGAFIEEKSHLIVTPSYLPPSVVCSASLDRTNKSARIRLINLKDTDLPVFSTILNIGIVHGR